jgi:hypothetical protein
MIWPVVDPLASFDDLIDEASTAVPALCRRHHVELLGRPRWTLRRGFTIPGSGGAHTVLVAEAPAKPVARPVEVAA